MNHLGIKFPLPKPAAPVARRELTVITNSDPAVVYMLPGTALVSDEIIFAEGDSYSVSLVDVNATGHRSMPSGVLRGSIDDDIRPAAPESPTVGDVRHLTAAEATAVRDAINKKHAVDVKQHQEQEARAAAVVKAAADKAEADRIAAAKLPAPVTVGS